MIDVSGPDFDSPKMVAVRLDHGGALSLRLHPASTLKQSKGRSVTRMRERMIQHGLLVVEECRGFVGTKTRLGGCSFPRLNFFEVATQNLSASTLYDRYCPMLELYCLVSICQSHPVSTRNIRSCSFLVSCALQSSHQPSLE
jgi:hypothetical protein